ncbi:cadherin-like beta sandwich domain-containing protein, partial [Mucilaginibacter sp. OK098]|uniref:cadherin-like beta sandwich domain-containing protein n=1 Tax=Mucilaginibacter sp. OK098 TaxID=1855297 RepID=UPI000916B507
DDNNLDTGIAVDRLGNIFVSFQAPIPDIPQVVQVTGTGGYNNLGSGLNLPTGVAVDGIGNVFVADFGSTGIVEYPVNGAPQLIVSSGLNRPNGVALDGAGNIYESDAGTNTVKEIKAVGGYFISPGLPAGLNFDENTGIISGTPTAASPATNYTVTAYNISGSGSATVNIKVVNIGLSGLALSSGILSPTFAADTTSYTAIVPAATTSITETPTSSTPSATITVNGTTVASGTASASIPLSLGANTITTVVTTAGGTGTKTYTVKVGRGSADALLTSIHLTPATTLTLVSGPSDVNYTAHVPAATSSVTVTATEQNATATITVNGTPVASGAASPSIPLSIGNNVINIVSTAQNGVSSKKYTINLARGSSDALLTSVHLTPTSPLIIVSGPSYVNYKTSVPYTTTSVTVTSTVHDATATIAVNGTTVASGVASPSIPLNVGSNVIDIVVTAQNGVSTKTYTITATRRAPSSNALLTSIRLAPATHLTIVSGPSYVNYTTTYHNSVSSCTVRAIEQDLTATITVNGTPVASGAAAPSIPLTAGSGNVINIVSTAQDGTTTKTYTITVTRNAPGSMSDLFQTVSVTKPTDNPIIENDGLVVHQGVSPNGDGIDDVFTIEGLTAYPQNKVSILDRNGAVIFLAKGYDNQLTGFDGHSNINGRMQLPGTYFYTLDYTVNGENKHKTGYIILKY